LLDPKRNNKFLTEEQIKTVKQLQNALAFTQEKVLKKPSGLGTVFIQLKQAGALTQIGAVGLGATGSIDPVSAGAIILAPYAVAKAFTNPKIAKLIIDGAKPRNFRTGITGISQLVTKLAAEDIIPQEEADAYIENLNTQSKEFEKNIKEKKPTYSVTNLQSSPTNIQTQRVSTAPINTRVTDVQTRPVAAPIQGTMPTGGLQERIAQSNQLDQFIPVRWKEL